MSKSGMTRAVAAGVLLAGIAAPIDNGDAPATTIEIAAEKASPLKSAIPSVVGVYLTPRQQDVLLAFGEGLSWRGVQRRLCIAPGTLKNHITNVNAKLGTTNPWQAALVARWNGLIDLPRERLTITAT
jgi:Response regulator containing a CheY-like receiver domain and an HTH DNA-binding domain